MDDEYEVVVVGAGVVGCAVADALAATHEVLVIDREGVASGATGRAAGLVAPTLFYGDLPAVARHANGFFRAFDGTKGFAFNERRRYDYVSPEGESNARDRARTLRSAGFPVAYLDAEAVEVEAPRLRLDGFAGAVRYDDAGWVDPYALATALQRRAVDRGAEFVTDRTATSATADGVEFRDERVRANDVVVAAGWRTPDVLGTPLPIRPYRTQCAVLDPQTPLDGDTPMGRVGSEGLYFRPEHDDTLLVGGSHDLVDDPGAASRDADESFVRDVATSIPRLVRGFDDAGLVTGWAGVDSATPDARPILDRIDGLHVAAGFNGLGVLAAPIAAETIRGRVAGNGAAFDREPFRLDRFPDRESAFDLRTTSDVGR